MRTTQKDPGLTRNNTQDLLAVSIQCKPLNDHAFLNSCLSNYKVAIPYK